MSDKSVWYMMFSVFCVKKDSLVELQQSDSFAGNNSFFTFIFLSVMVILFSFFTGRSFRGCQLNI